MILCVFLCFVSAAAAVTEVSFPDKSLGIILLPVTDSVCTYLEMQFRNYFFTGTPQDDAEVDLDNTVFNARVDTVAL